MLGYLWTKHVMHTGHKGKATIAHRLKLLSESRASGLSKGETGGEAPKRRLPSAFGTALLSCPHGSHTLSHSEYSHSKYSPHGSHTLSGTHAHRGSQPAFTVLGLQALTYMQARAATP